MPTAEAKVIKQILALDRTDLFKREGKYTLRMVLN